MSAISICIRRCHADAFDDDDDHDDDGDGDDDDEEDEDDDDCKGHAVQDSN